MVVTTRRRARAAATRSTTAQPFLDAPPPSPVRGIPQLADIGKPPTPMRDFRNQGFLNPRQSPARGIPQLADIGRPARGDYPLQAFLARQPADPRPRDNLLRRFAGDPDIPMPNVAPRNERLAQAANLPSKLDVFSFILPKEQKEAVYKILESKGIPPNDVDLRQYIELVSDKLEMTENELSVFKKRSNDQQRELQELRMLVDRQKRLLNGQKQPDPKECRVCYAKPISRMFFCGHPVCETCANCLQNCHICQARTGGISLYLYL